METLAWPVSHPLACAVTFAIVFLFALLIATLANSVRAVVTFGFGPFWLLSLVSFVKQRKMGMPLFPWDFHVTKEVTAVLGPVFRESPWIPLVLLLGVLALVLAFFKLPAGRIFSSSPARRWAGVGATVALALLALANNPLHDELFKKRFVFKKSQLPVAMLENGLLINFVLQAEKGLVQAPVNYSPDEIQSLMKIYPPTAARSPSREKPDVIVLMSESLFDPLLLKGVTWKRDPLRFTRTLAPAGRLSRAMVPTFGGKTANSEFEFLTGHALRFLPAGAVPYDGLIEEPQPSIVRTFKAAGYRTVAIHPNYPAFWNRANVYHYFDFDSFLSEEAFGAHPQKMGRYTSDLSILKVLEDSLAANEGPSLHFIVSMQNHMPYAENSFLLKDLLFEQDGLSRGEQVVLNYYSKLVAASDEFHERLVEFLKARKKPVLLVIYGDHLPALMDDFGMFVGRLIRSKDPKSWSVEEARSMYSTPLVVWSNFGVEDEKEPVEVSLLSSRLMRKIGIPLNAYQTFLARFSDQIRIVNDRQPLPEDEESQKLINQYRTLQYAILTGALDPSPKIAQQVVQ